MDSFNGVEKIYGRESLEKIQQSYICIIGIGGVGSWTAESLARSGVTKIDLIDLDEICVSNTNRQIHTLSHNIGLSKVQEMKKRLESINPKIKINAIENFYTPESADQLLNKPYSIIIDAIDSSLNKAHLINESKKRNIPIITVGASGGKTDLTQIQVKDLAFSYNDTLLARVRRDLRTHYGFSRFKRMKFHITSIFSSQTIELPKEAHDKKLNCNGALGSLCTFTASMGLMAAHEAIKQIIDD